MYSVDFFQVSDVLEDICDELSETVSRRRSPEDVEQDVIRTIIRAGGKTAALRKQKIREKLKKAQRVLQGAGGRFRKIDAPQIRRMLREKPVRK